MQEKLMALYSYPNELRYPIPFFQLRKEFYFKHSKGVDEVLNTLDVAWLSYFIPIQKFDKPIFT